jgi:CheY-specific phosphatase CheX
VIDQDLLVRSIKEATSEVFSTMLDMSVHCIGPATDSRAADSGVVALVGITGDWGGSGVFCCSPAFAAIISARMLGSPDSARPGIDEEVLDVVAELTNMMVGNIKNGLEPVTGPLAISVPTVIHGKNFQFPNGTGLRGATLCFEAGQEVFEVRISLAPADQQSLVRARIPVLGLAHMEG